MLWRRAERARAAKGKPDMRALSVGKEGRPFLFPRKAGAPWAKEMPLGFAEAGRRIQYHSVKKSRRRSTYNDSSFRFLFVKAKTCWFIERLTLM